MPGLNLCQQRITLTFASNEGSAYGKNSQSRSIVSQPFQEAITMKRLFALCLLLFIFSTPALAQTPAVATAASTPSPANFLPFDTAGYMELRIDDAGLSALNTLGSLGFGLSNTPTGGN